MLTTSDYQVELPFDHSFNCGLISLSVVLFLEGGKRVSLNCQCVNLSQAMIYLQNLHIYKMVSLVTKLVSTMSQAIQEKSLTSRLMSKTRMCWLMSQTATAARQLLIRFARKLRCLFVKIISLHLPQLFSFLFLQLTHTRRGGNVSLFTSWRRCRDVLNVCMGHCTIFPSVIPPQSPPPPCLLFLWRLINKPNSDENWCSVLQVNALH